MYVAKTKKKKNGTKKVEMQWSLTDTVIHLAVCGKCFMSVFYGKRENERESDRDS